jgi:hypothetical protein
MHYEKTLVLQIKIEDEYSLDWFTPDKVGSLLRPFLQDRIANESGTINIVDVTHSKSGATGDDLRGEDLELPLHPVRWRSRSPTGGTGAQAPELATLQSPGPEFATLQSLRERIEALEDWARLRDEERCAKSDPSHRVRAIEERLEEAVKTADKVAEDALVELSEEICKSFERIITGGSFLAAWHKVQHGQVMHDSSRENAVESWDVRCPACGWFREPVGGFIPPIDTCPACSAGLIRK